MPLPLGALVEIECIGPCPVLHFVRGGVGVFPLDVDSTYRLFSFQVHDDPLGMESITFAGEFAGQVWIAFPISEVRPGNRTIAAGGKPTVRQSIRKNVFDRRLELGAGSEVSAPMCGVTPGSIFRPVPRCHPKLSIIAITDWPPGSRERFLNNVRGVDLVDACM